LGTGGIILQISAAQNKTAGEFVDLVASKLGAGRAVDSETAIASIARLAGSLLFRSFEFNVPSAEPGSVVLSHEANEHGPQLIGIMQGMLQHFGISMSQGGLGGDSSKRGGSSRLTAVESLTLLQEDALRIVASNGLQLEEAAQAAAMATAFIVKECAPTLGPEVGFNIAAYGFVEGLKTMPPAIGSTEAARPRKKPWYQLW
jgi:hypothetical protein